MVVGGATMFLEIMVGGLRFYDYFMDLFLEIKRLCKLELLLWTFEVWSKKSKLRLEVSMLKGKWNGFS